MLGTLRAGPALTLQGNLHLSPISIVEALNQTLAALLRQSTTSGARPRTSVQQHHADSGHSWPVEASSHVSLRFYPS